MTLVNSIRSIGILMYFRSCLDFLLSLSVNVPGALWEEFQSSVKVRQY